MNAEKKQSRGSWKANKNRESSSCGVGAKTFWCCLEWCVWKAYSGLGDDGAVIPNECVKCCTVFVWHSKQEYTLALASNNISCASWEVEDLCPVHGTSLSRLQWSLCSNLLMSAGLQAVYENQYLKGRGGKRVNASQNNTLRAQCRTNSASPVGVFIQPRLDLLHLKHHYLWLPGKKKCLASRCPRAEIHRGLYDAPLASQWRMRQTTCNPLALHKNGSPLVGNG